MFSPQIGGWKKSQFCEGTISQTSALKWPESWYEAGLGSKQAEKLDLVDWCYFLMKVAHNHSNSPLPPSFLFSHHSLLILWETVSLSAFFLSFYSLFKPEFVMSQAVVGGLCLLLNPWPRLCSMAVCFKSWTLAWLPAAQCAPQAYMFCVTLL